VSTVSNNEQVILSLPSLQHGSFRDFPQEKVSFLLSTDSVQITNSGRSHGDHCLFVGNCSDVCGYRVCYWYATQSQYSRTTAACRSFPGALVNRVVLGALEACVTLVFPWAFDIVDLTPLCRPGLGLMTPFWWRLQEQPLRHLSWVCIMCSRYIVNQVQLMLLVLF